MKKIVFFLQTKTPIGGGQLQFLDLAAYVLQHYSDYEIYNINYRHPIVEGMYKDFGIKFLDVDECDYSQFVGATFVTPVNYTFYLSAKLKDVKGVKICTHPNIYK